MTLKRTYELAHPPLDGSLYFHEMITFNAAHNPEQPFYNFYDAHTNAVRHVSHAEFYRACQRVAHAVRPERRGPEGAVVAIVAQCDTILYHALTMGLVYAGLVPFPISPRNSAAAVVKMMRETGCHRVIATRHLLGALLDGIQAEFVAGEIEIEEPPALVYAYPTLGAETGNAPFVPYPQADDHPAHDAVMYYLHSSGSTSFPKAIPITYLTALHWCISPSVLEHVDFPTHLRVGAAPLPPFHTLGVYVQLVYPVASLQSISVYAPMTHVDPNAAPVVPNSSNAIDAVVSAGANALVTVPAFLETWATEPDSVAILSRLAYVAFAGGPLAKKMGDALVEAGVRLVSLYGATEFGPVTHTFRSPAEQGLWEWVRFGPNRRVRWVPQGDGTLECQVLTCPTHQVSVENLPDVKGYATSDVFVQHSTIKELYKIVGRLDDVLIHSSGEKTVPAPMETVIGSCPYVSGVCMFGRGRNQTGVLVEPRSECAIDVTDETAVAAFRNQIWPEVDEANSEAPGFSRIFKEMILVTSGDKPMMRAGKGTVIKKATLTLYEREIDALYVSVEASTKAGIDVPLPLSWSQDEVETWLMVHVVAVNGEPIQVDIDVFEQGFDSLSSTFLGNRIMGSLGASSDKAVREAASRVVQNVVFAYPTVQRLAYHLVQCVVGDGHSPTPDMRTEIEDMIAKYSVGLGEEGGEGQIIHDRHVVLLTGSTGGLGSYLLASLVPREDVSVVYALNRPSKTPIEDRQRTAFDDRGLDATLVDSDKIVYVEGGAAQVNLSLDARAYDEIRNAATIIIHNAWRLDFNLTLSSFEGHVRGTRHLIDLARASSRRARFMFTSSISSAQGWDRRRGAFPEEVQMDASVAVGAGYGASKYVSERILAMSGLHTTSFRIGQITGGAPKGVWSTTDWVPIIVKSSVSLGAFPDVRGFASWIPPHAVCDAILNVAFAETVPPPAVNVVHPRPVPWTLLMQTIRDAVYAHGLTPTSLPLIPFSEWITLLDAHREDMTRVPAIKLRGFMGMLRDGDAKYGGEEEEALGFVKFTTGMQAVEPLSAVDARLWVDYWASAGMFETRMDLGGKRT